jgi:outer membrane scaffolding protein for murein synthesis (MipA/OmpV family)
VIQGDCRGSETKSLPRQFCEASKIIVPQTSVAPENTNMNDWYFGVNEDETAYNGWLEIQETDF